MADGQCTNGSRWANHRAQRHLLPGVRCNINQIERVRVELEARIDLKHHPIVVQLRKVLRNFALAEGVVECVVNSLS
jgi:hypothetical protein